MIKLTDAENTSFPLYIRRNVISALVVCSKSKELPFQHTLVYCECDPAPFAVVESPEAILQSMTASV